MASAQTTLAKPEPVEHTFIIHNFHTESGVTLPEAKIIYGTYGHLNAAGDNAILLPSHYMADMHGYDWLIGPGKALDPARQFLNYFRSALQVERKVNSSDSRGIFSMNGWMIQLRPLGTERVSDTDSICR